MTMVLSARGLSLISRGHHLLAEIPPLSHVWFMIDLIDHENIPRSDEGQTGEVGKFQIRVLLPPG